MRFVFRRPLGHDPSSGVPNQRWRSYDLGARCILSFCRRTPMLCGRPTIAFLAVGWANLDARRDATAARRERFAEAARVAAALRCKCDDCSRRRLHPRAVLPAIHRDVENEPRLSGLLANVVCRRASGILSFALCNLSVLAYVRPKTASHLNLHEPRDASE